MLQGRRQMLTAGLLTAGSLQLLRYSFVRPAALVFVGPPSAAEAGFVSRGWECVKHVCILGCTLSLLHLSDLCPYSPGESKAGAEMDFKEQVVCNSDCVSQLENVEMVTTASGLQYKDIVKGKGPNPPTGYQVRSLCHTTFQIPSAVQAICIPMMSVV